MTTKPKTVAPYKLVIVAGQEWSVPTNTPNDEIKQQLSAMGFTDVANSKVKPGTREVNGVEIPTVEFVKEGGTKGLGGKQLLALLSTVPRAPLQAERLTAEQRQLLQALQNETLTIEQAWQGRFALNKLFGTIIRSEMHPNQEGDRLCARIAVLDAVPADVSAW